MTDRRSSVPERIVPGDAAWEFFYYEHQQRYELAASRARGLRVLDAACGVGYGSAILARAGAHSVTGIDVSEEAITYARKHFVEPGVTYEVGDVQALPFGADSFDLVVSFETIEHIPDPQAFIREVHRVLTSGGLFICSTPNRDWEGRSENPYHLSEMSLSEFENAFAACFEIDERYYQSHSPAYLRFMDLLGEVSRIEKAIRFSWLLRLENRLRGYLRKEQWDARNPLSGQLARAVPGDFTIQPLTVPRPTDLTFIFVGRARPDV